MVQVFVYGTLKAGYRNHYVMQQAQGRFLGKCRVTDFACINTTSFPYAIKRSGCSIIGEVYALEYEQLKYLDWLEGYPTHYDREEVETDLGTAWIYYSVDSLPHLVEEYGLVNEWK